MVAVGVGDGPADQAGRPVAAAVGAVGAAACSRFGSGAESGVTGFGRIRGAASLRVLQDWRNR
ncbi:hypothetical protein Arub01_41450 [Actinomadura rubrobrunea]|uniref:Uncharacterized protein n=1 Tax=Actinomadura rubrobrunea TaxID=115335 RepID=A0A9W6PZQ5_9ACTN|nr:hypothetical protein Arub01_41450 [Actinomadura rubrobrunea]